MYNLNSLHYCLDSGVHFKDPRGTAPAHALDEAPQGERQRSRRRPFPEREALRVLWAIQGSNSSGLALGACHGVKNFGKPCAGKLHARFDEGGQPTGCPLLYPSCLYFLRGPHRRAGTGLVQQTVQVAAALRLRDLTLFVMRFIALLVVIGYLW